MQKASSSAAVAAYQPGFAGTIAEKWGRCACWMESLTMGDLNRDLRDFGPDLAVVNTGFPCIDSDMAIAKRIKEAIPEVLVVAFGVYFTMLEKEGFQNLLDQMLTAVVSG
jgi:hypothetical protein